MHQQDITASDEARSTATTRNQSPSPSAPLTPAVGSGIDSGTPKAPKRESPSARIRFTRFSGPRGSRLTKTFFLDPEGQITKTGTPKFSTGVAETIEVTSIEDVPDIIDKLDSNQCIATGVFDQTTCRIVPKDQLDETAIAAGVRSRSKEHITQPSPSLILLDHDSDPDMPERLRCAAPDELMAKLGKALPTFANLAYVGAGSCSAGVCTPDRPPSSPGGLHTYIEYAGGDFAKIKEALEVRLWNAGLGYMGVARNGALLVKTIIDLAVLSPERLIYEARPELGEGLTQRPRIWHRRPGRALSVDLSVTPEERQEYQRLVREAKADPETQAKAKRMETAYHDQEVAALANHRGIDRAEAAALLPRAGQEDLMLRSDRVLDIRGQSLTASQLLARGEEFDETAMPDPIEGRDYGATTAKFYFNGGIDPCIHSFAHGLNRVYRFERQPSAVAKECPEPLDPAGFPHVKTRPGGGYQIPATIENLEHLVQEYGITIRFNVVKKQLDIVIPGLTGTPENYRNTAFAYITSLATLNGIGTSKLDSYIPAIGDRHPVNPVADWIKSKPWDGVDRLSEIYATLTVREDFPERLKRAILWRWLLSAVAAALKSRFHGRGVLTLQGPQGIGKTSWICGLVPDPILREDAVLLGHHLDVANKDSVVTAVGHWIVELGELDSSFKKDIARLKGFMTATHDKVRRPYGKADSEYPRRTVFCATVNEDTFLIDPTGNSRWWTLPVVRIDYTHQVDMQQLFAQLAVELGAGRAMVADAGRGARAGGPEQSPHRRQRCRGEGPGNLGPGWAWRR